MPAPSSVLQGMGAWIALGLANAGADVAVTDIGNEERLHGVAEAIRGLGRRALELKVRRRACGAAAMPGQRHCLDAVPG